LSKSKLIILGSREFAEEVADIASECKDISLTGFCENFEKERCNLKLRGLPIIWIDDILKFNKTHKFICAIGTTKRKMYIEQAERINLSFTTLLHPSVIISKTSRIGEGSIVNAGSIVAAETVIGKHVIINRGNLIGHHTTVGSFVTISPGSNIAGRVSIGDGTYIGMGSIILNDIKIGSNSVVGAGSVVTKNVPDNTQVMGIPAKIVKENISGK
jgi:sugar O-acyltransferase (sialic acid O-acetyltransferase NeuD family)